jgi:hypothetical protein
MSRQPNERGTKFNSRGKRTTNYTAKDVKKMSNRKKSLSRAIRWVVEPLATFEKEPIVVNFEQPFPN